jgi:UDP-N-acetylglucosamine acyltransferase
VSGAKFRRNVFPGDRLQLEVTLGRSRSRLAKVNAVASVDGQLVAEAELLLAIERGAAFIDPSAHVDPAATVGEGTTIGPHAVVGPDVTIGRNCHIGASVVIDGWTEIGDDTQVYPMASIGLAPQDLKYRGERTRLVVGRRNIFREFVTINRGTAGGGGETTIGDNNLFMAYVHVAHDCHVGSDTIFGPHATLGGHVSVEDFVNISAGSAVHQFCRVGRHAFIGGYSVVTKDALPFARTIGSRPARIFGVNTIGLSRRGFTPNTITQLRQAYRYLLQSKLNTTRALAQIEQDESLGAPEIRYLVDFIRHSQRGVILRRTARRAEELVADD